MTSLEILKQEDILCVNGEFYIFMTKAHKPVKLNIESDGRFQTWPGTMTDLKKATKEKKGNGLGLTLISRRGNQSINVANYTLTFEIPPGQQIQVGINAPRDYPIIREGIKKRLISK